MSEIKPLADGYRHISLREVTSTNDVAYSHAKNGDGGKLWVTAEIQTKGKGSRGRGWTSEAGNLYASLLLKTAIPPQKIANLSFVASLALHEAISHFAKDQHLSLKWPNDVLLHGAKVSGILLENHPQKHSSSVIIGMGINCATHPDSTRYKATDLASQGIIVEPGELFVELQKSMDRFIQVWDEGRNFKDIRNMWIEKASGVGERIIIKLPTSQMSGTFVDIDETGRLLLETLNGAVHKISSADIFFSTSNKKGA